MSYYRLYDRRNSAPRENGYSWKIEPHAISERRAEELKDDWRAQSRAYRAALGDEWPANVSLLDLTDPDSSLSDLRVMGVIASG